MKALLTLCLLFSAILTWAADTTPTTATPNTNSVKGEVLEVKDVESYTYLRLKTRDGETWAAVNKSAVVKGSEVTINNAMVMNNFESHSLKQTFKTIIFGTLGNTGASSPHAGVAKAPDIGEVKVPKASGPNAHTVAEIIAKAGELKDQPVLVRGKVVKYNPGIMGKNWVHLHDGSGSASAQTNDLLVTTLGQANVGDIITAKGTVHTDKDFGAGYAYKVLIEDATLSQ